MPQTRNVKPTSTVAIDFLGCKLNQAEVQRLSVQLAAAGYRLVSPLDKADIYILNTCTVTHVADRKSRHLLRLARRRNPGARLIAIGCYAERAAEELARIEGVEFVLGSEKKADLLILLGAPAPKDKADSRLPARRTRVLIKAQEGCRNYCAYCIVPLVRGRERSVPAGEVIAQIQEVSTAGGKEVVLTGTEIGAYDGGADLRQLVERVLKETDIARLRLSSLQPHQISPGLIKLWQDPRLCPHFHLSLQSGSETVLKRMKRRYTTADYRRTVGMIRQSLPDAAITTDVIVGFPGETEAEFLESYDFCRGMDFARIHVFSFSPRPGTAAAEMPEQVNEIAKKERSRKMLALAKESAHQFRGKFLGRKMDVLWEQGRGGIWTGLTGNYIKVYVKSDEELTNRITPVKLEKLYRDGVWGNNGN